MASNYLQKANSYLDRLVDYSNPSNGVSVLFQNVRPQVELMSRIWLLLPGNGNPLASDDPTQTLSDLIGFGTIKGPEDIANAVDAVLKALSAYMTDERKSFAELVGTDTITTSDVTKIFQTRRDDEVREQNELLTTASDLNAKMKDVADKLAVPLVPVQQTVQSAVKNEKINIFKFLYVKDNSAKSSLQSNAISYWILPPILDVKNNEDVAKLLRFWDYIFVNKLEPDQVKSTLNDLYGLSGDALTGIFSRINDVLSRQIAQSQKILSVIEADFKLYNGCLTAALELFRLLVEIGKYFGFEVGKPATVETKTEK